MNEKMLGKKWMLPVLPACSSLVLASGNNLISLLTGEEPSWPILPVLWLCILPAALVLTQKIGKNLSKPLFGVSRFFLRLQLLGNLMFLVGTVFNLRMPIFLVFEFFRKIPGAGILSSAAELLTSLHWISFPYYGLPDCFGSFVSVMVQILYLISNYCFLVVCSEFTDFHQLDSERAKLYALLGTEDECFAADHRFCEENQTVVPKPAQEEE